MLSPVKPKLLCVLNDAQVHIPSRWTQHQKTGCTVVATIGFCMVMMPKTWGLGLGVR